ncbi:hypothetical protein [Rhodopseudomonas sp. B29]|uniref:hypothetical protein n=1 Tax=Rhodopseudomonas sp. B29 TaxID=95607 RepID=UPI001FCBADE6|nr:hypothetical protein [Rhodopseudomonas sp. B29]
MARRFHLQQRSFSNYGLHHMGCCDDAWLRYQQARWLAPNGERWVRPDAARFLSPGSDLVAIYPALALKYNPNQPRVPAGHSDGGQWTSGTSSFATSGDRPAVPSASISEATRPMGNVAIANVARESTDLFSIAPKEPDRSGVRLAGDLPEGADPTPGEPGNEPPPIPQNKPSRSADRTRYFRAAADWLARNAGLPGLLYEGSMRTVDWLRDWHDVVLAARDGPKPLQELMNGVSLARPGYDVHHINEVAAALLDGYSLSQMNDPSNLVSIPRLKHYQITGWYSAPSVEFKGLSPREFLRGKSWEARREVDLRALRKFGALQP